MLLFILISIGAFLMVTTIVGHFALQKAGLAQTQPVQAPAPVPKTAVAQPIRVVQPTQNPPQRQAPRQPSAKSTSRRSTPRKNAVTRRPVSPATPEPPEVDPTQVMMPVDADDPENDFQVLDDSCLNFDVPDYMNINHDSMDESSFTPNGSGNDEDI